MKRYAIKNDYIARGRVVSVLNYDESTHQFTIDIPEGVSDGEMPYIAAAFRKRGKKQVDSKWSMRWVQGRITPSSRQNIGQILRVNGMRQYDEYQLLIKNQGRSCQDEYYIEEMK